MSDDTLTVYRCWWSRGWVAQLGGSEVEDRCPFRAAWRVFLREQGKPDPGYMQGDESCD